MERRGFFATVVGSLVAAVTKPWQRKRPGLRYLREYTFEQVPMTPQFPLCPVCHANIWAGHQIVLTKLGPRHAECSGLPAIPLKPSQIFEWKPEA